MKNDRDNVNQSSKAYDFFKTHLIETIDYREAFYILLLNNANDVLGYSHISLGGTRSTVVDIKLIFQIILKSNASGVILCHNHPSGNLKPSENDITITNKIIEAGKLMDVNVLDHIIITSESYYSFADNNLI